MSYPTRPFVVIANGRVVGDLPTPALIDAGGGEAYVDPETPTIWRLRDDKYDARHPGITYTRVRVEHLRQCPGWGGIPHLTDYGTTFVNGMCPQCDTWHEEDRRARRGERWCRT